MSEVNRDLELAGRLAQLAAQQGGRTYFVGGCVRDRLLHRENKDIDVEVHGLTPAQLEVLLDGLGTRLSMGESFGIYALAGYGLDIAMPRRERALGRGHRDFEMSVDPHLGPENAARRRDFTVNAMMQDVLTGTLLDPFGGQADLERGILRHVDDVSFGEDPLRVLRCAQFAARFGFAVAEETVALCRSMDLSVLPRERVAGELEKALLNAPRPSVFFRTLREMEQLDTWFGELSALIGVKQNPKYHAEGDVWEHTMLVLDAAADYRAQVSDPLVLMLAALTHDLGKAVSTRVIDGVLHAYGHETAGLPLTRSLLERILGASRRIPAVLELAEHHMRPNVSAVNAASIKSTNRMFDRVSDPEALMYLALADSRGKIAPGDNVVHEEFLRRRLEEYRACMARPRVMGRDLLEAGLVPGHDFADLLSHARKLHLAGVDKDCALKQTLAYARKKRKKNGE